MAVFIAAAGECGCYVVGTIGAGQGQYLSRSIEDACALLYTRYSGAVFPPQFLITVGGICHFPS